MRAYKNYAKLCGECQIMRNYAENGILCEKLRNLTNYAIPQPPQLNGAYGCNGLIHPDSCRFFEGVYIPKGDGGFFTISR